MSQAFSEELDREPVFAPRQTGGIALGRIVAGGVVLLFCGIALLMVFPAVNAARRNTCSNYMRQIGLAVANHESATKRYPTASTGTADMRLAQTVGGSGNAPAASDDGFSWLFEMLPFVEETVLHEEMQAKLDSDDAQTGPFDADFVNDRGEPYSSTQLSLFRCPTFSGDLTTRTGGIDAASGNYVAIAATDFADHESGTHKSKVANWENGVIVSRCWKMLDGGFSVGDCQDAGVSLRDLGDGISKTIIACESREMKFNAWISGASMWIVAASPNSISKSPGYRIDLGTDGYIAVFDDAQNATSDGTCLALGFGSASVVAPATDYYFQASDWATGVNRAWGPSSEHAGGVVMQVYADAHAQAISTEVNPTAYLRFITRNSGDPARAPECD